MIAVIETSLEFVHPFDRSGIQPGLCLYIKGSGRWENNFLS